MLDKDKLWVITYVGVKHLDLADIHEYCENVAKSIKSCTDESIVHLIVPNTENDEIKIDCINPKELTEDLTKQFETQIKRIQEIIDNFKENERK